MKRHRKKGRMIRKHPARSLPNQVSTSRKLQLPHTTPRSSLCHRVASLREETTCRIGDEDTMKNAHLRFGTMGFNKSVGDSVSRFSVSMDRFIGERSADAVAKAHFISVVGGDAQIAAASAIVSDQQRFTVEGPDLPAMTVNLGKDALCHRGSIQLSTSKRPLRHLIAVSQEFGATANAETTGRTLLAESSAGFLWASLAQIFGLPAVPEWAEWFYTKLDDNLAISPVHGLGFRPVLVVMKLPSRSQPSEVPQRARTLAAAARSVALACGFPPIALILLATNPGLSAKALRTTGSHSCTESLTKRSIGSLRVWPRRKASATAAGSVVTSISTSGCPGRWTRGLGGSSRRLISKSISSLSA